MRGWGGESDELQLKEKKEKQKRIRMSQKRE